MTVLVLIPTYNEKPNISLLIERLLVYSHVRIMVIDDNSPDGTAACIFPFMGTGRVKVINRSKKAGRISAVRYGLDIALSVAEPSGVVVEMDADLSHDPTELQRLLHASQNWDVVIGSRYKSESRLLGWPKARLYFSRTANWVARRLLRLPFSDLTSSFRCYSFAAATYLSSLDLKSRGFIGSCDILFRLYYAGFSIGEVPITFANRHRGSSKLSAAELAESLLVITRLGFRGTRTPYSTSARSGGKL